MAIELLKVGKLRRQPILQLSVSLLKTVEVAFGLLFEGLLAVKKVIGDAVNVASLKNSV